jgi:multicomponent Na+:H+ antiporter subunit G
MNWLLHAFTMLALFAGSVFFVAGTVGLLRFPDTLTRLHALTKVDNLGLGLIVLALLPRASSPLMGLKLIGSWLLIQLSGAVVTQLLARVALARSPDHRRRR